MTRTLPAALAALFVAAAAAAQPPAPPAAPVPTVPADGTEIFRWLLHKRGVKPLKAAEFLERADKGQLQNVLVIVIGRPDRGEIRGRLAAQWGGVAVRGGGAALVTGDWYYGFELPYSPTPGGDQYVISSRRMSNPDPDRNYDDNPDCPLAIPRPPPARNAGPEWGLFAGLTRVATNRPTTVPFPGPNNEFRSALAGFPPNPALPGRASTTVADRTFAVGGSGPHPESRRPYRFLALADPDVFTNEMMVPLPDVPPSDNLTFANRVVSFLVEEGQADQRRACLFYHNGRLVDRFDTLGPLLKPPSPLPNLPPFGQLQEKLVDAADEVVDKLQENDALTRMVVAGDEERRRAVVRVVAEVLLALAAVCAAVVVGRRVWGARHPTDLPPPPPGGRPVVRDGDRPAGVADRRQRELLRRDDLSEPVRAAVRELFRAARAPADAGHRLPQVRVSEEVRRPDSLMDALRDLWKLGYARPGRVTARRWADLEPLFVRVRQAHADGKWAFVWHEPDPRG